MPPGSSAPQGAPRCRPSLYLTLSQPRAMRLMARLHHLCPKTVPWHQGARPHGVIRHARCPHTKKEAAKKFPGREKLHPRFPRHLIKTAHRLQRRRADLVKTKFHLRSGPQHVGIYGRMRRLEIKTSYV